ncbi:MAG: signal peptidase II [Patescibacteria group bacterium]
MDVRKYCGDNNNDIIVSALFVLDRVLKWRALTHPPSPPDGFFVYHQNPGIAFSLPLAPIPLITLLILGVATVAWLYIQQRKKSVRHALPYLLILAGAVSNIIDRPLSGGVIDYFFLPPLGLYFNIADVMIVGGILLLIFNKDEKIT